MTVHAPATIKAMILKPHNNDEQNGVMNVDNKLTSAGNNSKSLEKLEENAKNGHDAVNEGSANKAGK